MAGGLAILAIAPIWSDLSNLINVNNSGWVINNSIHSNQIEFTSDNYLNQIKESRNDKDVAIDFYLTLKNILNNRNQLEIKRLNSFNSVRRNFNIDSIGEKWESVLNQI